LGGFPSEKTPILHLRLVQFGSQAMADRFTYVPGIGLFIILAWGLPDMAAGWRHRKVVLACASAAILSALAICTSIQIRYWRDSVTLFRHAIEVTANNAVMHYNLATVLETEGKPGEAALHYAEAIRINALYPEAHGNLAVLLARQGRSQEAMKHFQAVLRLKPDDPWPHINLGIALEEQGRTEEAVACYRKALALRPDLPSGLANLAWLLATDETIGSGNSSEAVELAERACALTGYEHPEFLDTLAAAYANASRFPDAVRTALKAVELARTKADAELTRAIEHRLRLYQEGRPCRDIRRPQDRVQSPRDSASGD
jgi:Flp pilus assembly protein TadD